MGNKLGVAILFLMLTGLLCCKSRPADIITKNGPTDSPTHQTSINFVMFDSTWRNDSSGIQVDYGINRTTTVLIDSAKGYVVYDADTFKLKMGDTGVYESLTDLPYQIADVTLYPDTIRFFGTGKINWGNSQTDHVVGYKVR